MVFGIPLPSWSFGKQTGTGNGLITPTSTSPNATDDATNGDEIINVEQNNDLEEGEGFEGFEANIMGQQADNTNVNHGVTIMVQSYSKDIDGTSERVDNDNGDNDNDEQINFSTINIAHDEIRMSPWYNSKKSSPMLLKA